MTAAGTRSIVSGQGNSGINSTGDHNTNIQTTVQAEHVTQLGGAGVRSVDQVPPAQGVIGAPGAGLFVGREPELACLHTALTDTRNSSANAKTPGAPGVVVQALHGLGGIGKSTLAARYVELHAAEFTQVVWITADSTTSVETGLAEFAVALEPELAGALPTEALRERAISWLCAHNGWLVILDNVTNSNDIRPLLARATTGQFLLTSRQATGWHAIATPLRLDVLHPDEARDLIARIVGSEHPALRVGAEALCERLGFLPLAVEQAGAYMAQNQVNAHDYEGLLDQYPAVMFQQAAEGATANRTIAQIWAITLDKLADILLAGDLLRIVAWFAPDAIPRYYLTPLAEPPELLEALGKLAAYNMITLGREHLTVHRLVQEVSRTPDPHDPHRRTDLIDHARDSAGTLLCEAIPGDPYDPATWLAWRELTPHVTAYAQRSPEDTDTDATSHVLDRTATFLESQGSIRQAIDYFQRALRTAEQRHEPYHTTTNNYRNNLAHAYYSNGNFTSAISLFEQALVGHEHTLGPTHPDTLSTRNNLGLAYRDNGNLARAIPLLEQVLTDYEHTAGPTHPATLTIRNNLAMAYHNNGEIARAVPVLEQALSDREQILGPTHPDTLMSRNNLAIAYHDSGKMTRAITLYEQTLTEAERTLGPTHPSTLTSRNNLAMAYHDNGELTRAIFLLNQTLIDYEHTLGLDHPNTKAVRNNLELVRRAASARHDPPSVGDAGANNG